MYVGQDVLVPHVVPGRDARGNNVEWVSGKIERLSDKGYAVVMLDRGYRECHWLEDIQATDGQVTEIEVVPVPHGLPDTDSPGWIRRWLIDGV